MDFETRASVPVDPVEQALRQDGIRVLDRLMETHITNVFALRSIHRLDDTDLLTSNIRRKSDLPKAERDEVAGLHNRIRDVIEQIATRIEDGKYEDIEKAVASLPLVASQRQRASSLVRADKQMQVSYQTLNITVEFFSELNQMVLKKIERESPTKNESNVMLGNAIMIYEMTDFMIRSIEGFTPYGVDEIKRLYAETMQEFADLRKLQKDLELRAKSLGIDPEVRQQTLDDIRNREIALNKHDQEWEAYLSEVMQLNSHMGEIRATLPLRPLELPAAIQQRELSQLVARLGFLKQNSDALKGTIEAIKGFRLIPLTANRVNRLFKI